MLEHHDSTDYNADSSDHSSTATPLTQSPRHRATTIGDSPLARMEYIRSDSIRKSFSKSEEDNSSNIITNPMELMQGDEAQRKREANLRQHSFFQLRVHLICGNDLVAMDKSGTSDPYVKFKLGGRLLFKSRTVHKDLNPVWDETFVVPIEDPFQPINIKVKE